jgi:hypothetical protein
MGRVVHGVSCPWGELSVGRVVHGAKCPWGEMSVGRIVRGARCPWGELSLGRVVRGAKCLWGEMSWGEWSWGEFSWGELSWGELSWGEWSGNLKVLLVRNVLKELQQCLLNSEKTGSQEDDTGCSAYIHYLFAAWLLFRPWCSCLTSTFPDSFTSRMSSCRASFSSFFRKACVSCLFRLSYLDVLIKGLL